MLTPLQKSVLTVMLDHPHSNATGRVGRYAGHASLSSSDAGSSSLPFNRCADRYAGSSSLHSNQPCCPLCRTLLTPFQPAVLTVMTDHAHSTPTGRADRYAGNPHYLPVVCTDRYAGPSSLPSNWGAHRYAGPFSFHSKRPCGPLCQTILAPLQLVVLIVMADHPHSFPTGSSHRYTGSF